MLEATSSSTMDSQEQAALVAATQAGNTQAFGRLYDAYSKPLYRFIYYKTHHRETAEDLLSQLFTQALQKIQGFNPEKGIFSGWLYQIARNLIIDHYRKARPVIHIDDAFDISDGTNLARDTEARFALEKVEVYLKQLTSEQRDIIIMRIWQHMSYAEIAAALGKSEASAKMAFSRAITKLRKEIPLALLILLLMYR